MSTANPATRPTAGVRARLVIPRNTADRHVSAILGKLDVRSRGEAVAAARRLPLARYPITWCPPPNYSGDIRRGD